MNNDMNKNNNNNTNVANNNKMDIHFFLLHSNEQEQQKTLVVDSLNNDNNDNNKTCVLDILSLIHSGEQTPRAEEMLPGWRPGNKGTGAKRLLENDYEANDLSPKRHKKIMDSESEDEDPFVVVADDCVSDACTEPVDQATLDAYFAPISSERVLDTNHLDNQSPLREEDVITIYSHSDGEDQDRDSLDGDQDQDDKEDSDASSTSSYEGSLQSLYMSQQMKDPEISLQVLHALSCGPRPSAAPRWQASSDGLKAPCTDPVYRAFCKAKNTKGTFSRHTASYVIHP